jgi:hypothetical protein
MPEYLAPGVYVEEVSFRSKSIEGVPTSTTGFAGVARYGPVQYTVGPSTTKPRLITSFTEFERVYGTLMPLELDSGERIAYLAHAARAFFNNGGRRLYVSRVFAPVLGNTVANHIARMPVVVTTAGSSAEWAARWPGDDGNVLIDTQAVRGKNLAFEYAMDPDDILARHTWGPQAKSVKSGAVVELTPGGSDMPIGNATLNAANLRVVSVDKDRRQSFIDASGAAVAVPAGSQIGLVELRVTVYGPDGRVDTYDRLGAHPNQQRDIAKVLELNDPEDENSMVAINWVAGANAFAPAALMVGLQAAAKRLAGGSDGDLPGPDLLRGDEANPDIVTERATGLEALGELDDIAIVALPDGGAMASDLDSQVAADHLIAHAEKYRYRIAVVDARVNSSMNEIRDFRSKFDSKYAAIYHPWIEILDPLFPTVPGRAAAQAAAAAVRLRHRHLRPQRHRTRRAQGAGQRGRARPDQVRAQHQQGAPRRAQPRRRELPALLRRPRQPGLGRAHHEFRSGMEIRQRAPALHLPRALDRQGTQWAVFEPNNERLWTNVGAWSRTSSTCCGATAR